MIRLALLRHGQTAWNRAGRIQGRTDIPLDIEAREALAGLALPAPWDRMEVRSSPLKRARETAELVAGREPSVDNALVEMDWGDWEGRKGAELIAASGSGYRHIEEWGWDFQPPGGESVRSLRDRLLLWVKSLDRDTLAVCHIGVMRVLLAVAHGWDFAGPAPFRVKRNRLYVLSIDGERLTPGGEPVRLTAKGAV